MVASNGQYSRLLLGMGPTDSRAAHRLLEDSGIDHTWEPGELGFRTGQERLDAIYHLWKMDPENFGWRWRSGTLPLTQEKKMEWMATAPVKLEYLVETQMDGSRSNPGSTRRPLSARTSYVSEDEEVQRAGIPQDLFWPRQSNRKPAPLRLGGKGTRNKKRRGTV